MTDITLAQLRARIVEEGECWVWTGHSNKGLFPQWRFEGKVHPARRLVWIAYRGPIIGRRQIGVRAGCSPCCVHPEHLVSRTKSQALSGKPLATARRAKIAAKKRASSDTKLTLEQVRELRASDEPNKVIAARLGITPGYAWRIRDGQCWKDHSSPFAGLGERRA